MSFLIRVSLEEDSDMISKEDTSPQQFELVRNVSKCEFQEHDTEHGQMFASRRPRKSKQTFWFSVVIGMLCLAVFCLGMMVVKLRPSNDADSNEVAELTSNLSSERLYAERPEIPQKPISKKSPCSKKSGERLTECEEKVLYKNSCQIKLERLNVEKICDVKESLHKYVYANRCTSGCSWCASESETCVPIKWEYINRDFSFEYEDHVVDATIKIPVHKQCECRKKQDLKKETIKPKCILPEAYLQALNSK